MSNASTNTGNNNVGFRFASRMRTTPTVTAYNYLGTINSLHYAKHNTAATAAPAGVVRTSDTGSCIYTTGASGLTVGYAVEIIFHYTASAEL